MNYEKMTRSDLIKELKSLKSSMEIAEREQVGTALREHDGKYHKIIETANDAIFIADVETGIILDANKRAGELLGMPVKEIVGMHQKHLHPPKDVERYKKIFKKHTQLGNSITSEDIFVQHKDGRKVPVEISSRVFKLGGRKVIQGIFRVITERKQTEEELKRLSDTLEQNVAKYKKVEKEFRMSQSRFSRIFNSNMMGIAFWELSGGITRANDAFLNIVGYTRRDLQSGKVNWLRMTPREYAHLDRKGIEEVKRRGFCTPFEKEYIRKDGKRVPVLIGGASIEGNGRTGVAYVIDMTAYKESRRRLNVQYAVARVLAEATNLEDASIQILQDVCEALEWDVGEIWAFDHQVNALRCKKLWHIPSLNISEFKAITKKITFTPGVGLPGRVWASAKPAWIPEVTRDSNFLRAPIAAKEGFYGDLGFPIMSGSECLGVMTFCSHEIQKPDVELIKMMGAIGNQIGSFMKRIQANEELAERAKRLHRLSELGMTLTGNPIDVYKKVAHILYEMFNVHIACLSEIRGNELYSLCVNVGGKEMIDAGYCRIDITPCATVIKTKEIQVYDHVAERFPKDLQLKRLNAFTYCGFPSFDSAGNVIAVNCLLDDKPHYFSEDDKKLMRIFGQRIAMEIERQKHLNERRQIEETILHLEKMKDLGEITAGIAHEFNNILAIISGNAQLLEENFSGSKASMDCLRTIRRVAYDGTKILSRMYKFTDINRDISGDVRVNMRELLNQAIDFTMPRWKNMAQAEGITYKLDRKGLKKVPSIQGNPSELREVLVNIINNALDAMADGGRISFRTRSKEEIVFISISDTGEGMTEDVIKKIFDPFFTTKRPQGTGLGLSVSYGIITRHKGNIDVESKVGKGSTFTLRLPIKKRAARSKLSSKPTTKKKVKDLKILVVDDKREIAEVLSKFLSKEGHDVKSVDSGNKAIKLLKSKDFDLLLCDLVMPGISGSDVIKTLDTLEKRPKVGLVTGWSEEIKAKRKEDLKVDFIVRKPFDFSELSRNINDTLSLY